MFNFKNHEKVLYPSTLLSTVAGLQGEEIWMRDEAWKRHAYIALSPSLYFSVRLFLLYVSPTVHRIFQYLEQQMGCPI